MQLDLGLVAQRHNKGRSFYRPTRPYFDPARHHVAQIANEAEAKPFILEHHYAGSFPAAILSCGLFETSPITPARLVGVATFSVPMNAADAFTSLLTPEERLCDLGRFVLLDDVGTNGETWFLARAQRILNQTKRATITPTGETTPLYPIIAAFSDPVPRSDASGNTVFRGHLGKIYQQDAEHPEKAAVIYTGRGKAKTMWLTNDGTAIVDRTLNKLRNGEIGEAHVYEILRGHGAPARQTLEAGKDYVARTLQDGPFRKIRHRGNHRYIFLAGSHKRQKALRSAIGPSKPYPRFTDA